MWTRRHTGPDGRCARRPEAGLTPARHLAGVSLLALAFGSLALLGLLPTRGAPGIELPFLDAASPPVVVAFAGYPGCGTVCPTSLALLGEVARGIDSAQRGRLGLLFVNVERDTPAYVTERYARAFHPEFRGYSVTSESAASVYRELSLASYASREQAAAHPGLVYVFAREGIDWRIERVYRRTPGSQELRRDLEQLLATTA